MRFASLGSGSEGNGLIVQVGCGTEAATVLVDCGFAVRETERRLARLGLEPAALSAVLVTHEHSDHIGGVCRFARRHGIAVWATHGTIAAVRAEEWDHARLSWCVPGESFSIAGLGITPYAVPHDAREPVQYVFEEGGRKLGLLTDAGAPTPHIVAMLSGCNALILECNHDRTLLAQSSYPASLKARIGGGYGHLANDTSAALLAALDRSRLTTLVAAHLSKQNNRPDLARAALAPVMGWDPEAVRVADQEDGLAWTDV